MIELKNVSKRYAEDVWAVRDISFVVPEGTICCLIGTSGCGKTTTLKMVNRLIEPSSGEIRVAGRDIKNVDVIELRRSIGYVIQKVGLLPHLTVSENIMLLESLKGADKKTSLVRVYTLLETVGLTPAQYVDRYPSELSGGQQQRVGIARALMSDPPVILMDEPFGALDPMTKSKMHLEFLALNRTLRKTIVMVTHDLQEAFKLGDQIILMSDGAIVQKGTRNDFIEHPATPFAAEFVNAQRGLL
jgi:osmoprotectant transport system ATP-binding protein